MQVRHFISLALILLVATGHFTAQWYAWKVHLFEIPLDSTLLAPPGDYLWKAASWPMFYVVSRRTQHLHFLAILLANSLTWGAILVGTATSVLRAVARVRMRRRRKHAAALTEPEAIRTAPPTRMERIIELNSMLNRKRITEEEYRVMRAAIMREQDPEPEPGGLRVTAVTYTVPANVKGAQHVAWLEEPPPGSGGRPDEKPERRRGRAVLTRTPPATGRGR